MESCAPFIAFFAMSGRYRYDASEGLNSNPESIYDAVSRLSLQRSVHPPTFFYRQRTGRLKMTFATSTMR
jgi:hypothetical protein